MLPVIDELREYQKRTRAAAVQTADPFGNVPPDCWIRLQESAAAGRHPVRLLVRLDEACEMKAVRAFMIDVKLKEQGEVAWSNLGDPGGTDEENPPFAWLAAVDGSAGEWRERIAAMTDVREAFVEPCPAENEAEESPSREATVPRSREMQRDTERDMERDTDERELLRSERNAGATGTTAESSPAEAVAADQGAGASAGKPRSPTIRVQVDRLEHLMNLVGELVIDQTRLQRMERIFRQAGGADENVEALSALSDHLTRTVGELQQSVMKVRMLPVEQLFNRFPRMVRDTALKLGKEVDLVIEGKDTELDRTIIDEIGDPLTHLIRNALDHGLERPEERRRAGKPEKGILRIGAVHEDNQVVLTVEDDGGGIRAERIRASAIAKGIVSPEEAARLTDPEAVHLIFRPGFSTAAEVSDISGRGVGMDIVRTEIERLNGTIEIDTLPGKGTRFIIRLPLTLAIITGLRVLVSGREFILPMSSVAEIVRAETSSIRTMNGHPIVRIREQVVPVVSLGELLGLDETQGTSRRYLPLVLVGRTEKRVALAVDELLGNQEVVIKSLGSYVGQTEGVSGATILGNGNVALILDTADLLRKTGNESF